MRKTRNILLIAGAAVAATLGIYFLAIRPGQKKRKQQEAMAAEEQKAEEEGREKPVWKGDAFPLKYGSVGTRVENVQKFLNKFYNTGLVVDGVWGSLTDSAVKSNLNRSDITETIYNTQIFPPLEEKPAVPPSEPDKFDADSWAKYMKTSMEGSQSYIFNRSGYVVRSAAFESFSKLSDANMKKVSDVFNEKYGEGKTLRQWINEETGFPIFRNLRIKLLSRMRNLGLR